ncbi:hypothetical protein HDV05_002601, partial [Chytridiales sp. JEL 0842]
TTEFESELKKAKQSWIRAWNIHTGDLILSFPVDEYIHTISLSLDNQTLLTAGSKGVITGWNAFTGACEFVRENHVGDIYQLAQIPIVRPAKIPRKATVSGGLLAATATATIEDDDTGSFSYEAGTQTTSAVASKSQVCMSSKPPIRFVSVGSDSVAYAWSVDCEKLEKGLSPVSTSDLSRDGGWLVTVGGDAVGTTPKPSTMVRVWEVATATNRVKLELPETTRTEIVNAVFVGPDDQKLLVGCRNGLVRLYRSRSGEMIREFWADVEMALSESTLGYKSEWPFAVSGCSVVGYALHPEGKAVAVAVLGQERIASPAATLGKGVPVGGRKTASASSSSSSKSGEKVADMVLRDVIKLTFWDLEGNPLSVDKSLDFNIHFSTSDYSSVPGPLR